MSDAEAELLRLIAARSFRTGHFTLASGATSDYFIDGKMTQVFSAGAFLIGRVVYDRLKDLDVGAVGGLEVGAVPMTAAVALTYHLNGREIEGFWVRNAVKDHGTKKRIEGNLTPGMRVAVVDDVLTTGGSAMKAVEAVRAHGCEVACVLALVDRRQGAAELFRSAGIPYHPVFGIEDVRRAAAG
jgi:orotate phosphoribosyltransferase